VLYWKSGPIVLPEKSTDKLLLLKFISITFPVVWSENLLSYAPSSIVLPPEKKSPKKFSHLLWLKLAPISLNQDRSPIVFEDALSPIKLTLKKNPMVFEAK